MKTLADILRALANRLDPPPKVHRFYVNGPIATTGTAAQVTYTYKEPTS